MGIIVLGLLQYIFFKRGIFARLRSLTQSVISFGEGNLKPAFKLGSKDEIGILANEFCAMAKSINKFHADLISANDRFEVVTKATNEVIYDWDIPNNHIIWNESLKRNFFYEQNDEQNKIEWWENLIHPEEKQKVMSSIKSAFDNKEINFVSEYRFKRGDGFYINVLDRGIILYDHDNKPIKFIGSILDMTKQKRFEEALRLAKDSAEASNKVKTQFLSNISHEFRTPLNGIIGLSNLLEKTKIDATQKRFVAGVKQSSHILLNLVNDLLDFAKIESGKFQLSPVEFRLRDEIGLALKSFGALASLKKIELVFYVNDDVPDLLIGDSFRLKQIISNLVSNALKFTPQGTIVVRVTKEELQKEDLGLQNEDEKIRTSKTKIDSEKSITTLHFSVTDTGIGIPLEKQNTIFTPFLQADGSISRQYGGTGLGLSICNELTKLLGGTIWVESVEGEGSAFHFTASFEVKHIKHESHIASLRKLKNLKVLIIDDSPNTRRLLEEIFSSWDMKPFSVSNGEDGLTELYKAYSSSEPYQLLFLDYHLPGIDGYEVAKRILADEKLKTTPILTISLSHSPETIEKFSELGIHLYHTKPFSQSELLNSIQDVLSESVKEVSPVAINMSGGIDGASKYKRTKNLNILVAEDNFFNQQVIEGILSGWGCGVIIANNGDEVIKILETKTFDLILMDIQMPGMDGFEATRIIREREMQTKVHTPIIALTAHTSNEDKGKCIAAGMEGYVSKPIDEDKLWNEIEKFFPSDLFEPLEDEFIPYSLEEKETIKQKALIAIGGNKKLLLQLIDTFLLKVVESLEQIKIALSNNRADELQSLSHSLKGSVSFFVSDETLSLIKLLEEFGKQGTTSGADETFELFKIKIKRLTVALEEIKNDSVDE